MAMIERDREAVYVSDTIRSLVYLLLTAVVLFLFFGFCVIIFFELINFFVFWKGWFLWLLLF